MVLRGFAPIVDTLVKERLTGAIILVGLIVVLVPELLSGPIRPAARAHGPGSSAEEPPLRSYTINLADEPHGGSGTAQPQPAGVPSAPASAPAEPPPEEPAAAPAPAPQPVAPPPSRTVAPPAARTVATPIEHKPPATPPSAASTASTAGATSGWVVQLGSFANRSNADRLAQQIRSLGYPVSVSRGTTGRRLYHVQAGPTPERSAAEQMATKLAAQGHKGPVMAK